MSDSSPQFLNVAPVLVVRDIRASIDFWVEKLGFEKRFWDEKYPRFAILSRGNVNVMLAEAPPGVEPPVANWRVASATNQAYIWVRNIDALYQEVQDRGAPIDFTLYNTPWGTREFGTQDLDEHDIAFGEILE